MNTKKKPQEKNDRYHLRSKGAPPKLEEMQEKVRQMIKKVEPLAASKQQTQSKSRKSSVDKSMSIGNKLQNTLPDSTNIHSTLDTSVSLPPLDYNIVDDMKKTGVNINFFKPTKVQSQQDILLHALGQKTIGSAASTRKGASTPPRLPSIVLNTLRMEEANSGFSPFLLSFKVFNYNFHNYLVDSSAATNVMLLSITKKINARWSETSARIIQLDKTSVPAIGELQDVII